MGSIAIPLPTVGSNQDIEVDIRVNGQLQQQNYRVEIFYWQDCQAEGVHAGHYRAECIREILASYDPAWQLYHIGAPTDTFVPITFVKRPVMKRTA